jgi:hypothetical protein
MPAGKRRNNMEVKDSLHRFKLDYEEYKEEKHVVTRLPKVVPYLRDKWVLLREILRA